jgi:hypothetical protein
MAAKSKPVHEIRIGRIRASIWANAGGQGNTRLNVTVQRLYKDESGWKSTASFGRDDLLLVGKVLDLAHSWICQQARA